MSVRHKPLSEVFSNPKLVVSFGFALTLYCTLIWILVLWWNASLTLSAVFGAALGWTSGILLAPYEGEDSHFRRYSKAAGGFITGFLLAKFDKLFEVFTDKTTGLKVTDPIVQRSVWICFSFFLITGTLVFVARSYWQAIVEEDYQRHRESLEKQKATSA